MQPDPIILLHLLDLVVIHFSKLPVLKDVVPEEGASLLEEDISTAHPVRLQDEEQVVVYERPYHLIPVLLQVEELVFEHYSEVSAVEEFLLLLS